MSEFLTSLYVDSRARAATSRSPTDFQLQLESGLNCQADTVMNVASVSFPITWWTIEPEVRDRVAVQLFVPDMTLRISGFATLQPGFYDGISFAEQLEEQLNKLTEQYTELPKWTCLYVTAENRVVVQWGEERLPTRSWQFMSEKDMAVTQSWTGPAFDRSYPRLIDDVLRMNDMTYTVSNNGTWVSGYFDSLAGVHVAYLHSDLGSYKTVGPRMVEDKVVICRIPIESAHGDLNHFRSYGHTYDFVQVFHADANNLRFYLTDHKGRVIDLHGGELSRELIFHAYPTL